MAENKPVADSVADSVAAALAERFADLARYREIVDVVPTPTIMADSSGQVTHVNAAYCQVFQVKEEDVLGNGWRSIIRAEDLPRVELLWRRVVEEGAKEWSSSADYRVGELGGFLQCTFRVIRLTSGGGGYVGFIYPSCASPVNCPVRTAILPKCPGGFTLHRGS